MRLLGLDIATNVGWLILEPDTHQVPPSGTWVLRGDYAQRCGQLRGYLDELHDRHDVHGIAWERPFLKRGDKVDKMEILIGLTGVAAGLAGKHELPWRFVTPQQAKKGLTGRQDADKADMIAAALRLGWKPKTEHEADAGAVALVAYEWIWPLKNAA